MTTTAQTTSRPNTEPGQSGSGLLQRGRRTRRTDPVLLVVGDRTFGNDVFHTLEHGGHRVIHRTRPADVGGIDAATADGVLFIDRRWPGRYPALRRGLGLSPDTPIFVVDDRISRLRGWALIQVGCAGVFRWPEDGLAMNASLQTLLVEPTGQRPGLRLERLVRARLAGFSGIDHVWCVARHGTVHLSGSVSDDASRDRLVHTVGATAGVLRVGHRALRAGGDVEDDVELRDAAWLRLCHTPGIDERTFALQVDGGLATLAGVASDASELDRAEQALRDTRGIEETVNLSVVDAAQKRIHVKAAAELTRLLEAHAGVTRDGIQVSLFGRTAVVRADAAADAGALHDAIAQHPLVDDVIDQSRPDAEA